MFYNDVLFTFSPSHVSRVIGTAQERGSLTQELVILVILVVIALALIFVCGLMGRRAEEAGDGEGDRTKAEPISARETGAATKTAGLAMPEGPAMSTGPVVGTAVALIEPEPAMPAKPMAEGAESLAEREPVAPAEPVTQVAEVLAEPELDAPVEPAAQATEALIEQEPERATKMPAETAEIVEKVEAVPAPSRPDDLKVVEGIGPKVSRLLNEAGIFTFAQLAVADPVHLKQILDAAKLTMMNPESWPKQARLAATGDWDALKKMQDELKGGRRT